MDGFTLADTVSYDGKHNEANGEDGADGHSNNLSHNLGAEGPTEDDGIREARRRRVRGMLATLALSQGVPMILAGDEFGQTQGGNNNAYCQDNETTWLAWTRPTRILFWRLPTDGVPHGAGARTCVLCARRGRSGETMVARWHHPRGGEMTEADWQAEGATCVMLELMRPDRPDLMICLNAGDRISAQLPDGGWVKRIDSSLTPVTVDAPVEGSVELDGSR